jgi:hypothetical protein
VIGIALNNHGQFGRVRINSCGRCRLSRKFSRNLRMWGCHFAGEADNLGLPIGLPMNLFIFRMVLLRRLNVGWLVGKCYTFPREVESSLSRVSLPT